MHWQTPEQELPRWAQEVIAEDKVGNHFVCSYFPDHPMPWIVELGFNPEGARVYGFFTMLKTEDIKYWSNIEAREDD